MTVLTAQMMRELEAAAAESGLSYVRLMENAGSAATRVIRSMGTLVGRRVAVLCGRGNNGGDGCVIARKLLDEGARVTVVLMAGVPVTPQAKEAYSRLPGSEAGICDLTKEPLLAAQAVESAALIVDAVYGIGFHGAIPDYMRHLFRAVNERGVPVVAVDIPSGLHADSGVADPDTVRAARTVTFSAYKPALTMPAARAYYGEVTVVSIGIDEELIERFRHAKITVTKEMVQACFSPRDPATHKGTYGKLLTVTGSYGMAGAARLCAEAALRTGVGLLVAALPREIYPIVAAGVPEAVYLPLDGVGAAAQMKLREQPADAVVLGCGLGQEPQTLVWDVLEHGDTPLLLDADGINLVCRHIDRLKTVRRPMILTPHAGEMARLCGCTVEEILSDREGAARRFAEEYGVILVLKGHETLIAAPGGKMLVSKTGNPGMATGGSGDVLAGMIGSLLAQGMDPLAAAYCGVYLHGAAGDRAAEKLSQHAMLPRDIIAQLGELFSEIEKQGS